jgi:hypothetical protein
MPLTNMLGPKYGTPVTQFRLPGEAFSRQTASGDRRHEIFPHHICSTLDLPGTDVPQQDMNSIIAWHW